MRSVAAALALALPCAAAAGVAPAYGGTVRIAVPSAPRPDGSGPGDLLLARATSAPLLEVDAAGALRPGALAEVPAAEAGGRAFRLRLRPDLRTWNGAPIRAADVAARLAALVAHDRPSPAAWVALPILGADAVLDGRAAALAGVQVLSDTELLVTLAFPLPEFPWLLAAPAAALPAAGPFVAVPSPAPGAPLALRANGGHHRGRPFADALEIRVADARTAARLLARGDVQLVLRPEAAGGRAGPALPLLGVTVAVVSGRLGPGAEPLRRALAAIDRADLARRFVRGPAEPLATIVPAALLPGAPPPAPGAGGGTPPARIVLLASAAAPDQRALAERLQVRLFDRGVQAAIQMVDPARLEARLWAGDFDVALVHVAVRALRPALAAGQIAFATRGPSAARRATSALAGLGGDAALSTADALARELGLVPLVASGVRASLGTALQGLAPGADGDVDPGDLWLLGGGS